MSAGGVVYRCVDGRIEAVLCGHALDSGAMAQGQHQQKSSSTVDLDSLGEDRFRWSLAKGTPDAGETMEETALREVREETGLEVGLSCSLGAIDYWFVGREPDVRFHKTVHFYLMVPLGGGIELHDPEFDVVRWFEAEKALKTLAYANEVEIMRRALKAIPQA